MTLRLNISGGEEQTAYLQPASFHEAQDFDAGSTTSDNQRVYRGGFDATPVSVPDISDIPSGFDAIFQCRADVLSVKIKEALSQINRGIGSVSDSTGGGSVEIEEMYVSELEAETRYEVTAETRESPNITQLANTPKLVNRRVSLAATFQEVELKPGDPSSVRLIWSIEAVLVKTYETELEDHIPTMELIRALERGQEARELEIRHVEHTTRTPLASAPLTATVPLNKIVDDHQCLLYSEVDFARAEFTANIDGESFNEYRDRAELGLDSFFADVRTLGRVRVTPRFAFTGQNAVSSGLPNISSLSIISTVTPGNLPGVDKRVLSLCVSVNGRAGDPNSVTSFVDDQSFASYIGQELLQSVVTYLWNRRGNPVIHLREENTVELSDGESDIELYAQYEIVLGDLLRFGIVPGNEDVDDHIVVSTMLTLTIQKIWEDNTKTNEITDVEEIGVPSQESLNLLVVPFQSVDARISRSDFHSRVDDFLQYLFGPMYLPVRDEASVEVTEGVISSPLGAVFQRGRIEE